MSNLYEHKNGWDEQDVIKMHHCMVAAGLRYAVYSVRDAITLQWGNPQFHMTYNNKVAGVLSKEAAELLIEFNAEYIKGGEPTIHNRVSGVTDDHTYTSYQRGETRIVAVRTRKPELQIDSESDPDLDLEIDTHWPEQYFVYEHEELRALLAIGTLSLFVSLSNEYFNPESRLNKPQED